MEEEEEKEEEEEDDDVNIFDHTIFDTYSFHVILGLYMLLVPIY
jgi:hypothetical protein